MAYSPASVLSTDSSSYPHLASVWYDRVAIENLKANLPFLAACERRTLPLQSGKLWQGFTYETLAANTTPGGEGTVGSGIKAQTRTRQATISQYFDFMSFSDLIVDTAIDNIVENHAAEMGYRAALTVNTLVSTEFDVVGAVSGCSIDLADNEFMSGAISSQATMSLRGMNAHPKADGYFYGIIHPFAEYDMLNDNTAGGIADVLKNVESGVSRMLRGVQGYNVIDWMGVRWIETTTVPTTSNFPSSGKTGYHSYVLGQNAVFAISLGATEIPEQNNFRVFVNNWGRDKSDPAGVIGSSIAYNFKFACVRRPPTGTSDSSSNMAMRRIRSEASIT